VAALLTLALVWFVPFDASLVKAALVALALLDSFFPVTSRSRMIIVSWIVLSQLILAFTGFYFSDDSLRHLHDGFYLLRGIDIYLFPPAALPVVVPTPDYHRMIGSVYFPVVQFMSMIGSLFSVSRGYVFVFHGLCSLLFGILAMRIRGRVLSFFSRFVFSPAFVLIASGRHEDLLAAAIFFLSLTLHSRGAGFFTGLLPFIKPDAAFLSLLTMRKNAAYLLAMIVSASCLLWFSFQFLVISDLTLPAFLSNLRFFADLYEGYNPLSLPGPLFFVRIRPWIALAAFLAGLVFIWRAASSGPSRRFVSILAATGAAGVLFSFALRGVWHPWYFCSAISALIFFKKRKLAQSSPPYLVLFYLPIADLRAGGGFHSGGFYVAVLGLLVLHLGHKFLTRRNSDRL
jgi:hypothetical protein